jgi:CDP-paratose 2-epimerase
MRCTVTGELYTIFGYGGKQVRDNIHSADVVAAFAAFHDAPRRAAVYNLGGGRESNCSMLEAIGICERLAGRRLAWKLEGTERMGDHRWWISDLGAFQADHPAWGISYDTESILRDIHDQNAERWLASAPER